jgi:N utilization substance protein B
MRNKTPPPDRHLARALALQGLYQWQLSGADAAAIEAWLPELAQGDDKDAAPRREADMALCRSLLHGVMATRETLVATLAPALDRPFDDLSPVEANLLLLATWELTNSLDTPAPVILNEAIELAKQFGSNEGHRFVNGVLDKVTATLRPDESARNKNARSQ